MKNYYVLLNELFDQLAEAQADDNTLESELVKSHIQGLLEGAKLLGETVEPWMVENWQEVA